MAGTPPDGATLFSDLPGAPPASDTAAWAPAGSKPAQSGPAYVPRFVDQASLSMEQRHDFKQIIASGDMDAYAAFAQRVGGEAAPGAEPPPELAKAEGAAADPLAEYGLDHSAMEAFDAPLKQWTERLDALPEAEREQAILDGEAYVLKNLYRGSEPAMEQAVGEINTAAVAMGLDLDTINSSAMLADWKMHVTALNLARQINARGGS